MTEQTEYVGQITPRHLSHDLTGLVEYLLGMSWRWEASRIYSDGPFGQSRVAEGFAYTKKQAIRRTERAMRRHYRQAAKIAKRDTQTCAVRMVLPEGS